MLDFHTPIRAVQKVGPQYTKLLEKLEIATVGDLLYHFPFRYDDFSTVKNISDVIEGEIVTVKAVLGPVSNVFTRNGKRLTTATAVDFTGKINILWFNQQYLAKSLTVGKTYTISGKISRSSNKLCFMGPELEETKDNSLNTGRLVAVYAETSGVTSKWLRARINDVLSHGISDQDFLPDYLVDKYKFPHLKVALDHIHFPNHAQQATHAKTRFAYEELFTELINVENRKTQWQKQLMGHQMELKVNQVQQLIKNLPFVLTESQQKSIAEIIEDMTKEHPMNRLLEGDVGTGKTVVAVVAAYFAYLNGFKTLYMAPTEILARQHFETFQKLLKNTDVKLAFKSGTDKSKYTEDFDILIGTHALLFKEESYLKVGLVIIDEQHRFGVEQRGKIIEMSKHVGEVVPHLLTMTATPIPRTLALTLYGDLEISNLQPNPKTKRNVSTKVVPETKRQEAYEWISAKNVPTFIVCPLIDISESESLENVKSAENEFRKLKETYFKGKSLGLLHGRMKSEEKQKVIDQFKSGEIKVLVSTPVIEVGIDIPDAAIIVIESAERYGLASLHQLRGRVGRNGEQAYCFVFTSNYSKTAYSRLKNLETIENGLELSELDMRLRGQGDIFTTMQHGYKKFKAASLENLEMIEEVKKDVSEIFTQLDQYPLLKEKLSEKGSDFVKNN